MTKTNLIRIYLFKFLMITDGNTKSSCQPAGCTLLLARVMWLGVSVSSFFLTKQCQKKYQTNCATSSEMKLIWMSFYSGLMMNEFVPQMCH